MATIKQDDFIRSVADALQYISFYHPVDYITNLARAYEMEQSHAAKDAMAQILINSRMCAEGHRPVCQDTGIVTVFLKIGMDVRWDAIMTVHLRGHFNVVRATINHFRSKQDGVYVMWSSTSGLIGNVGQSNYGAAKMGIAGFSRIIAMEGARNNVRSNAVSPGAATRMTDSVPRSEEAAERREAMRAIQSPVRPAELAVALMSDAAKHISGQIFGAAGYNLSIFSQPRPIKTYSREGGWDAEGIVKDFFPRAEPDFTALDRTAMAASQSPPIPVPAS